MLKLKKFQGLNGTVCALYRAVTAIFGRIGRIATEDVVANEMYTSFVSLEACPLTKTDFNSLDLFQTNSIDINKLLS